MSNHFPVLRINGRVVTAFAQRFTSPKKTTQQPNEYFATPGGRYGITVDLTVLPEGYKTPWTIQDDDGEHEVVFSFGNKGERRAEMDLTINGQPRIFEAYVNDKGNGQFQIKAGTHKARGAMTADDLLAPAAS